MPARGSSSKLTRESPLAARQRARSSTAASRSRSAAKAVTRSFGAGKSRSTAAVMMPSVPSAPMKSCFRS